MPSHCAIPGCSWSQKTAKKNGLEPRSLFSIRRPDLARTDAEREHRQKLTNLILSMRDYSKGDIIKSMLHKES